MRSITLPRHYWLSFRFCLPEAKEQKEAVTPVPAEETKPRAPATFEERLWEIGKVRVLGILLPNPIQSLCLGGACLGLSLPVFFLDSTGRGLFHGFVTLGSLAGFAAFCWTIGMVLANCASDDAKKSCDKRP